MKKWVTLAILCLIGIVILNSDFTTALVAEMAVDQVSDNIAVNCIARAAATGNLTDNITTVLVFLLGVSFIGMSRSIANNNNKQKETTL